MCDGLTETLGRLEKTSDHFWLGDVSFSTLHSSAQHGCSFCSILEKEISSFEDPAELAEIGISSERDFFPDEDTRQTRVLRVRIKTRRGHSRNLELFTLDGEPRNIAQGLWPLVFKY
jgi:hypothetical protein